MALPESIVVCMGSSCFSRGNSSNQIKIREFLEEHELSSKIVFRGCRCGGKCSEGPNIWVDGKQMTGMTPEKLASFLDSLLEEKS